MLEIRRTKTIQCGERVLKLPYVSSKSSPLCPVRAVKNLLYLSPNDKKLPLFSFRYNGKVEWWTHKKFSDRLRELLEMTGYSPKEYSCHSFRRGGASLAFKLGLTLTEVKKRGDWKSHAVENYVMLDADQDKYIAKVLIEGIPFSSV